MALAQTPSTEPQVERAVVALLEASRDFTRAYEAWKRAPVDHLATSLRDLEDAQRRVREAQREASRAQSLAHATRKLKVER